jgi:hypothetical protein
MKFLITVGVILGLLFETSTVFGRENEVKVDKKAFFEVRSDEAENSWD